MICSDCSTHYRGECPEGRPASDRSPIRPLRRGICGDCSTHYRGECPEGQPASYRSPIRPSR